MSLRRSVADAIKTSMTDGDKFVYVTSHKSLGSIKKPTISVLLKEYQRSGFDQDVTLEATMLVTIAVPTLDPDIAEADLDDLIAELLMDAPHAWPRSMRWTRAARAVVDEKYHGWDIDLTVLAQREQPAPDPAP